MAHPIPLKRIADFFIVKIITGIIVVGGTVALIEYIRQLLPPNIQTANAPNIIFGVVEALMAVLIYFLFFRFYERRQITELSIKALRKNALAGFFTGLILQSLAILILFLAGDYSVIYINPVSFLIPGFIAAFIAGFVVEIIVRGIIFRLTEEKFGSLIALIICSLLFAVPHSVSHGATLLSVLSTTIQAGILLSSAYIFSRCLWLPMFLHFAWDFAEPGIYGAPNPGIAIEKSLFISNINGPVLLTGGEFGPGNSVQATLFCLVTACLFLCLAKRKNNIIKPYWQK